jgi:porphobilinogen synthase
MTASFPAVRARRLRATPAWRRLTGETRIDPAKLVLPLFVREGADAAVPISSMPGVVQHSLDSLKVELQRAAAAGIGGVMLFGVPEHKDATGSGATAADGILNIATEVAVAEAGDALVVQTDLCLDEFTDHGHCGVLDDRGLVDNDATLERYRDMALAQAASGSQLAYAAKYASAFYGPFREAVQSSLQGDRRTYQLDPGNRREGAREVALDIDEGADIVMVKPAMSYLDVLADAAATSPVPVWAYQVSGEYAMIEAAAAHGWIDRDRAVDESLVSILRAGADAVLTYWAIEVAERISRA